MEKVILIFDIGKTNKKVLLFNKDLKLIYQEEEKFEVILDDDGFECDDIDKIETWIKTTIIQFVQNPEYDVKAVNFSTYGATLIYLDKDGKRLTPAYNYLKPMPEGVVDDLYDRNSGVLEFSRCRAAPALGMLNSGLQALWLKRTKPEIFDKIETILHFPQYLAYLISGNIASEYTSIGCHTALWNFDKMKYHKWCIEEGIKLPSPIPNETLWDVNIAGKTIKTGIGIHDSSASLAPYIINSKDPFILVSTGTWSINMNPFNNEPLTMEQLNRDCLSYLSISRNPVKSSRLFMGHIHDVNLERIAKYFEVSPKEFTKLPYSEQVFAQLKDNFGSNLHFFKNGIPEDYTDRIAPLEIFSSFEMAYNKLIMDIAYIEAEAIKLIIPTDDNTKTMYISGGFARNKKFIKHLSDKFPSKKVITSEIDNATALGAALVVWDAMNEPLPEIKIAPESELQNR